MFKRNILNLKQILPVAAVLLCSFYASAQTSAEILKKSEDNLRGKSTIAEMKMTIERPKWTREMEMKVWAKGEDYSLIYIKSPKREAGTTFLKREKEIWNWVPNIERVVKMPPSMMMQSWMGSDFTNDDLVRSSSILDDYEHEVTGEAVIDDLETFEITLIPKPEAPVVWGKVKMWISKEDYIQLKVESYDEDEYLINSMEMSDIINVSGRKFPTKMIIIPEEEPENRTIIEYQDIEFDPEIDESIFTVQYMKRVRE